LLDAAQAAGLKIAFHYWLGTSWYLLADYRYIDEQYGAHPALLCVENEPVVFLPHSHSRQRGDPWHVWVDLSEGLGLPGFWVLDGVFLPEARFLDGLTLDTLSPGYNEEYDLALVDEKLERASLLAHAQGAISVATVHPGGEALYADERPLVVARSNGETYETLWNAAASSGADWILIRSFNQWLEGTEIEPSVEYGTTYIEMTRRFADAWKAQRREEGSP
jgi:hypothetical protein